MVETTAINAVNDAPETSADRTERDFVIRRVLEQLGRPHNLSRVKAENLWDRNYRVNVYCVDEGDGPFTTVSMTDSFFVTVGADEEIVTRPTIEKKYDMN